MVENYKAKTINFNINHIPEEGSAVFGFIKTHVNDEFIDIKKQREEKQKLMQIQKDYELALKLQNEENNNRINYNNNMNVNNNNININNNNINVNNNNINANNNYINNNINRINTERNFPRNNNNLNFNGNMILNNVNKNKISKNTNINTLSSNRKNLRINMEDISNLKNYTMRENAYNNINNFNDFRLLTFHENDFKRDKSPNFFEEKKIIKVNKKDIDSKKKTNNKYNMDYCVICLGNFKNGEKLRKLSCFHIFHIKCINDWYKKKKSCPVDNKENLECNEIIYKF